MLTLSGLAQSQVSVTRTVGFTYDSYGNLASQIVEPDDTTLVYKVETDYAPDAYGSILTRTMIWQDPVLGAQSRVIETNVYDARSRFATTVTNAASQSETRAYDDAYGNLTSLIGPNGLTTTWQYDGWGRKTRETRADTTATTWSYRQCVDTCSNGAATVIVTQSWAGSTQTSVPDEAFSDVLGRSVRDRTWGFDGTAILTERTYDSSGRPYQTARPRFASATPVWTTLLHDAIGRTTQSQSPSASGSGVDTTLVTYNGLSITTTNPLNQPRTETRNGLGSMKSVTDAAGQTTAYLYDPWGNLVRTTDPLLNQINVAYDRLGRKTQLADPDLGTWNYLIDPLGQTWQQTDAKSQVTTYTFDVLGRTTRRLEADLDSRWSYDTATTGVGKLAEAYTWAGGAKDYRRIYTYDTLSRTSTVTTSLDWDYVLENSFDAYGRLYQQNHRRNIKGGSGGPATATYLVYNAQGYAWQTYRSNDGVNTLLMQVLSRDAEGHTTQESLGASGALLTGRGYNPYTGRLQSVSSGPSDGAGGVSASLQNDSYSYDSVGNVTSRSQLISTGGSLMSESLGYDSLNRLSSSNVWGQPTLITGYDALGDIASKANVGSYAYLPSGGGSVRPHAVSAITGTVAGLVNPSFSYDADGNLLSGLGRAYIWSSYNQPASIDKLSAGSAVQRTAFLYDTEHQRTVQTISPMSGGSPGAATTTIYYGAGMEKEIDTVANTTTLRTYVVGGYLEEKMTGTGLAATVSATRNARFFLQDQLGSPLAIVDESSTVLQRMSYDPWGRRRNSDGSDDSWAGLGTIANAQDHTGFTSEEQLDKLGLVNLNGRIYDPMTGRMTSADPTIADSEDTQGLNRYAYVLNNPLGFTDPTGFSPYEEQVNLLPDSPSILLQQLSPSTAKDPQELERVVITGNAPMSVFEKAQLIASFNRALASNELKRLLPKLGKVALPVIYRLILKTGVFVELLVIPANVGQNNNEDAEMAVRHEQDKADDEKRNKAKSDQALAANSADPNIYAKPPADAYDPNGPKAPGKPGSDEGFKDPKGGDDWVKNPNGRGYGWRDKSGDVWVPTGPYDPSKGDSHGGSHWDVQTPGGGYVNVYPGGARRP